MRPIVDEMNFRPAQSLYFSETLGVIGLLGIRSNLFESQKISDTARAEE
jgi:hypothetical protein